MIYLEIADIVSNAMIEKNKKDGSRQIPLAEAFVYGQLVCEILTKSGIYSKIKLDDCLEEAFYKKYIHLFYKYCDEELGILYQLREDKSPQDLIALFRNNLPREVVSAFENEQIIEEAFPNDDKAVLLRRYYHKKRPLPR